jgi:uncharacterized membrane protein YbaN (DUF454 family)
MKQPDTVAKLPLLIKTMFFVITARLFIKSGSRFAIPDTP